MDDLVKLTPKKIQINDAQANAFLDSLKMDKELMDEVHSLGINDEELSNYLPLLARYQENHEAIKKDPELLVMKLTISDSGKLDFVYVESEQQKKKHSLQNDYYLRDFPDEWLSASITSKVSFKTEREKDLRKEIVKANKGKNWFYVYGQIGTGKSYALCAFLNDVASKGKKVAFINANKRFEELKVLAISDKDKFENIMKTLSSLEYLVIDDFGSEFKSDYVRDTVVIPLLLERTKNHLFTAFASDYTLDEIEELYSTKFSSKLLAKRLINIIRSNLSSPNGYELEKGLENMIKR